MDTRNQATTGTLIPNDLHFIWYGSPVPEEQANRITEWQKINPHYKVNLWFDPTLLTSDQLIEIENWAEENQIKLRNSNEELRSDDPLITRLIEHARNESTGPFLNYAARSDIDRLLILAKFGGIYLDTDIRCKKALETLIAKHGIFFNHYAQGEDLNPEEQEARKNNRELNANSLSESEIKTGLIGNDIIATTKNNPTINALLLLLDKRYAEIKAKFPNFNIFIKHTFEFTINLSGPNFLRHALKELGLVQTDDRTAELDDSYCIPLEFFSVEKNDLSWMHEIAENEEGETLYQLPIKNYQSMDEFISDMAIHVSYELINMKKTYLNDYLRYSPGHVSEDNLELIKDTVIERIKDREDFHLLIATLEDEIQNINLVELNKQQEIHGLLCILQFYIDVKNLKSSNDVQNVPGQLYNRVEKAHRAYLLGEEPPFETVANEIQQYAEDLLKKYNNNRHFALDNEVKALLKILQFPIDEWFPKLHAEFQAIQQKNRSSIVSENLSPRPG